jgi:hypothetical protein|tara:strand:- start:1675 stop:2070 length:396 start_codon:yes stop_codon:yes gene_type:complete
MNNATGALIEESKKSEWDTRQLTARRIDLALQKVNFYSEENNYQEWMQALTTFYKEVSSKLTEDELRIARGMKRNIEFKMNNYNNNLMRKRKAKTSVPMMLETWEILLRRYADEHGLLMPTAGSIADAIRA